MYYRILKEYYNKLSSVYEKLYREEQIKKIKRIIKYIPEGKILDVGAGTGILEEFLDREFYLIDISEKMIEIARKKFKEKYKYFVMNAKRLPFKNEFFDGVISISMLQDVKIEDIEVFVEEMERVLKSSGFLIVTFLNKREFINKFLSSIRRVIRIETFEDGKEFYFVGQKIYKRGTKEKGRLLVRYNGKGEQAKKRIPSVLAKG